MYEIDSLPQLNLGRLGETGVTTIQIDISEWEALWPGISVGISMIAPGGGTPFLVAGVTADEADGVTYIEWAVGNDATALSGVGTVVVRGAVDSVVKRSVKADVIIEPGHPATGDPPEGYDSWMEDAIAALAAVEGVPAAEALRVIAEGLRVSAEDLRVIAEGDRVTAEGLRVTAEGLRVTAEGLRVTAEEGRVTAEGLRVTAEELRATAEGLRVTAEGLRVTAEGNRVSAEAARVIAEAARVVAEGLRDTAESTRAANEIARNVYEVYNPLTAYNRYNKVRWTTGDVYYWNHATPSTPGTAPPDGSWVLFVEKGDKGDRCTIYYGTAITGTSTTPTAYDTDIVLAEIGDIYMYNGSDQDEIGNEYICTLGGDDVTALWIYLRNSRGPGGAGSGDMLSATYDPESVGGDAFDMDNMAQGTTNKFVTGTDLTKLGNLSGTNTGDQVLPTRDSLGLDTDDTVTFANLSGTNTGDQTLASLGAAALAILAPEYSAASTYALGVFCTYDNKFYECTTPIATPEEWTAGHWTERTVGYVLAALKTLIDGNVPKSLFDAHSILAATSDNTPAAVTMAEQTVLARLTGGNIDDVAIGIADNNIVQIDQNGVADDDFARFTANGLEGRSPAETLADIGAQAKATISKNEAAAPALGTLANNTEYRCTHSTPTAAPTMTIAAIAANTTEFACNVIYKAKSSSPAAPAVTNNSGKTIKYQGDGVAAGTFTPVAGTVYRLGWVWDGIYLNCYIKGAS